MQINLFFAFLFFVTFLGFIFLESILFYRVIKYLTEKITLIKTFAAGMPLAGIVSPGVGASSPEIPDEDFGHGSLVPPDLLEDEPEFGDNLKTGDELSDAGI